MILGIDQITYGASDLATCRRFFGDWGLALTHDEGGRLCYESLNGCRIIIADPELQALPPAFEDGPTLREVVWGVSDEATLARLREPLSTQPGWLDDSARIGCTDPNGMAVRFQVSIKRKLDLPCARVNTWDRRDRIDQRATIYERALPIEVGHVVFFVDQLEATEAFYAALGFVTSDRYPQRGAFMRCDARGGHHDLFLLKAPNGKREIGRAHV